MKDIKLFKNQVLVVGICVFALVVSFIGGSYALFTSTSTAGEYNSLNVGDLEISYVDTGDGYGDVLSLNGAYPMSDVDGAQTTPYRFSIENKGSIPLDFRIKLKDDESIIEQDGCSNKLINKDYVMVKIDNNDPVVLSSLASTDYVIYSRSNLAVGEKDELETALVPGSSEIHEVRIWIKSDAPNSVLGKHFHGKVVVESNQTGIDQSLTREFNKGDQVTLADNSKWHVLESAKNSSAVVTLISDYNVNSDGTFCTSGTCSTFAFDSVTEVDGVLTPNRTKSKNSFCTDEANGCNMYGKNNSTVVKDSSIKTWLEQTYLPILKDNISNSGMGGVTLEDLTVTLPSMEQIANYDGQDFNQHILTFDNQVIKNSSYWTKTASNISPSSVWYVDASTGKTAIKNAKTDNSVGIRVVITTSKANIK